MMKNLLKKALVLTLLGAILVSNTGINKQTAEDGIVCYGGAGDYECIIIK